MLPAPSRGKMMFLFAKFVETARVEKFAPWVEKFVETALERLHASLKNHGPMPAPSTAG